MHHFKYKDGNLYCEDVRISDMAHREGTPLYVYSHRTLIDHYRKLKDAFREVAPLICFSMKANSNLAVCRALIRQGSGLDIVSGGELYRAMRIGARPERIVYASVGKQPAEIRQALRCGILFFNIESIPELILINKLARTAGRRPKVCIRVNPDITPRTHKYIRTSSHMHKFGLDFDTVEDIFDNANRYPNLDIAGLHLHIGSQITESAPFERSIKKTLNFIDRARINCRWLNIGGGLGIIYAEERPQTARQFARVVIPLIKGRKLKLILEPGRFIAGPSGILLTRVLYIKETPKKRFVIVDAGMNDLLRPSLYDAYHEVLPVQKTEGRKQKTEKVDIVGPICESGDWLAKSRKMAQVEPGQLLAIMGAGAYGFSMASNYNSRPRAGEVLVHGKKFFLVRKRENYKDLIKGEGIPKFLR